MSDYLPEEILIEILLKLPVKSLIRSTSVCKQWRTPIRSPSFISTHLSNTQEQALIVRRYDKESREHYGVIPKRGPFVLNPDSDIEFPFKSRIMGSCDGLLCLSDEYEYKEPNIIVWNPAIRNQVVLPQPQIFLDKFEPVVLGFGVASNVYKVVRIVYCLNPNVNGLIVPPEAEIFCLGTRGWRKLTGFDVRVLVKQYYPWSPNFLKGFVHWIGFDPIGGEIHSERNSILRFNVGDEVFDEMILPEELERETCEIMMSLYMMGESLGVCKLCNDYRDYGFKRSCDVWMMKDYGVKESWTKLYTIDTMRFRNVIGFRGSDEALLTVQGCEFVSYNPETKGIKHVAVNQTRWSFYVDDYKESLVLLGGGYSGDSGE